jgi:hypothetical protein
MPTLKHVDLASPAWVGHIPFAYYFTGLLQPSTIVELGCFKGNSLNAFCQSVQDNHLNTKVTGIDAWEGDLHMGEFPEDIYQDMVYFVEANYNDFTTLKKSYFDDAVNDFDDGSIDLLHIDGLHTYEAVKNDFETWLPKLSDKAVVLFHDTTVIQENFGVIQYWSEISKCYPSFNFTFSHGLGVLIVGANAPQVATNFISQANTRPEFTNQLFYGLAEECLPSEAFDYIKQLKIKEEYFSFSPELVNCLRDKAIECECTNLKTSALFMELAYKLRPNGPLINRKHIEYQEALAEGKTKLSLFKKELDKLTIKDVINAAQVDYLRDEAVRLESSDLVMANQLMSLAYQARPTGPFIKQKFDEYTEKLKN